MSISSWLFEITDPDQSSLFMHTYILHIKLTLAVFLYVYVNITYIFIVHEEEEDIGAIKWALRWTLMIMSEINMTLVF
jgi:hypothetical protein